MNVLAWPKSLQRMERVCDREIKGKRDCPDFQTASLSQTALHKRMGGGYIHINLSSHHRNPLIYINVNCSTHN